jgi:ataxia telangiectasia mutated family protein
MRLFSLFSFISIFLRTKSFLAIWSGETRTEAPASILENYFLKARQESLSGDPGQPARVNYHLARYCDEQYQSMLNDESNSTIARELLSQKEEELNVCTGMLSGLLGQKSSSNLPADKKDAQIRFLKGQRDRLKKQIEIDKTEFDRLQQDLEVFLIRALESYCNAIEVRSKWDMVVFRIVTLWFANSSKTHINDIIMNSSPKIPSAKFLVLMYQLSARLDNSDDTRGFQLALHSLITRMTSDHPHHT